MMRCLIFLCFALVGVTTAFGQQGQQASVRVSGGTIVGQFVPDGQQIAPQVDPAFQQQQVIVQSHQHGGGCGCPVCARRVLSQQTRERSKTIREITTVIVIEETHPTRVINTLVPQDPCIRQGGGAARSSTGLASWDTGFRGYRSQQRCPPNQLRGIFSSWSGQPLVAINAGVAVKGFDAQTKGSVGGGGTPYVGDPGYGGLGYSSQPVRPW